MLRISRSQSLDSGEPEVLRLEGRVTGPWVAELRRVCAEALGRNGHSRSSLVLDLGGVSFLDPDGIALLEELADGRTLFTNCSAFIAQQLKGVGHDDR